jgi:hypothetical protein
LPFAVGGFIWESQSFRAVSTAQSSFAIHLACQSEPE